MGSFYNNIYLLLIIFNYNTILHLGKIGKACPNPKKSLSGQLPILGNTSPEVSGINLDYSELSSGSCALVQPTHPILEHPGYRSKILSPRLLLTADSKFFILYFYCNMKTGCKSSFFCKIINIFNYLLTKHEKHATIVV
jgi:hypothetical protein